MITQERFEEIYQKAANIFDHTQLPTPLLEIKEDCNDEKYERDIKEYDYPIIVVNKRIFDMLGYFSCSTPNKVYLCKKRIEIYAKSTGIDINILTEIVAVHEIGHYIHCKINKTFCTEANKQDGSFYDFRKYFVESFAQLLTHKFCIGENENYCNVFNKLNDGQSKEYNIYSNKIEKLGGCLKECPKSILEEVFFKTNLEFIKNGENISKSENFFFKLFINDVLAYYEIYKEDLDTDSKKYADKQKKLFDLGLIDSFLPEKFKFISIDSCCNN